MASSRSRRDPASRRPGRSARGVVHPQRRVRFLLLGVAIVFSLFAAQLVRLQGLDAASVSAAAFDQRRSERVIPAVRGAITDINGEPMAVSHERKRVSIDRDAIATYEQHEEGELVGQGLPAAAADIAEVTGADADTIERRVTEADDSWVYAVIKDISPLTWQKVRRLHIPGVYGESFVKRQYPLGAAPAPLLGWVGSAEEPAGGIELTRDDVLKGTPGSAVFERGGNGQVISTGQSVTTPAEPGRDTRLSIDADLQWYAYDAIAERVKETGAKSGYALVQEIKTGRLMAMASYPGFDPTDTDLSADDLRNPAVEDAYEPGSTGKLITAAAALEQGLVDLETPIEVPTSLRRGGTTFRDSHEKPVQPLTFAGVLAHSSNMGTILYGEQLEDDVFVDYLEKFGLGSRSGLGLPGESPGLVPQPKDWSVTSKYAMLFGQSVTSNALQQLMVFQAVANGGVQIPPSVVAGVTGADGDYQEEPMPDGHRVIKEQTADQLTQMMMQVPSAEGTAPMAAVDGYHVAGKTSTADRYDAELGRYDRTTAAFVGFAPAEDPQYVVSVTVHRPTRISKWGGDVAGPVFSDIMRYVLQSQGVKPTDEPVPELALEYDPEAQAPGEDPGVTLDDVAIKDDEGEG